MNARTTLIEQLIAFQRPVPEILVELGNFPWDSQDALADLTRANVVSVLERFFRREISADQVEQWANALEGREDVGYEGGNRSLVREVLHELANPVLTRALTPETAQEWIARLT